MWKSPAVFRQRFRWDRVQSLSHGDPLFKVHYLGTEKIYSLDVQQAEEALGRLLERSPAGASREKEHALVVRSRYVEVKEISTGRQLTKTYLRDIAYCTADAAHPNVFLYICKQPGAQLHCRVFWCSRPERARDISACLARSFQRAMIDRQEGETNQTQVEGGTTDGRPIRGKGKVKNSTTLPVDSGKGWRRRETLASRTSLRVLMRRTSISD
ncbi:low density lipoprotein receptor adapter protein 1-B-like [Brachyhypopomus gauderio]|uniref:low density lipoprotein receptor adapter protein 1-B-like n=1 Tax=Brachyhypopomus gauderio TaxID=698409 RepID=UPI0040432F4C